MSSEEFTIETSKLAGTAITGDTHAVPVLSDSHDPTGEPAPAADDLETTRTALLGAYRRLLRQIEAVAGDARQADEVARLAEAAERLVHGRFARRLVFGE